MTRDRQMALGFVHRLALLRLQEMARAAARFAAARPSGQLPTRMDRLQCEMLLTTTPS